jgi:hypothetical protein
MCMTSTINTRMIRMTRPANRTRIATGMCGCVTGIRMSRTCITRTGIDPDKTQPAERYSRAAVGDGRS